MSQRIETDDMETYSVTYPRGQRIPIERAILHASRGAVLLLVAIFATTAVLGRTPSLETQMIIYLVGMVALNLPHGGYEHFTNVRRRGLPFGARYVGLYVTFLVGFVALFFVAPVVALVIAFATAVAKGGHGDLRVMDAIVGTDHLQYRPQRALAAIVRGGAIMIVPLVFWTGPYINFSTLMLNVFDPGTVLPGLAYLDPIRAVLLGGFGIALVMHLGGGLVVGGFSRSWLLDLLETSLLVVYFAVVPVVVAIGLYFPLWYSARQSARGIVAERETPAEDDGLPIVVAWAALIAGAFATALVMVALWVVAPAPLAGASYLPGLVAFYTLFICIVALPHVVVGEWLDVKRGIWYVP